MGTSPLDRKFSGNSRNNFLVPTQATSYPVIFGNLPCCWGSLDVYGINLPAGEDYEEKVGEDRGEVDHLPRHPHALPDAEVDQHPG
jgi:hypothetical protein